MEIRTILQTVLLFVCLLNTYSGKSQVGIGTTTPNRALEVNAPINVPPVRFTNLNSLSANSTNANLKSLLVDQNGDVTVGLPKGALIARIQSSLNSDLSVGISVTDITFDTDDLPAAGTISRTGGNFTILAGGDGVYSFAFQPQVTTNTGLGYITFWAVKNGVVIPNSGARNSSTGLGDTHVVPLIITLNLVTGDVVSFKTICTNAGTYILDYTAAAAGLPSIPAVIIDVRGFKGL